MKEDKKYNIKFFIEFIDEHYAELETSELFIFEKVKDNGDYQCIIPLYGVV